MRVPVALLAGMLFGAWLVRGPSPEEIEAAFWRGFFRELRRG